MNDGYFTRFIKEKKLWYKYSPEQLAFLGLLPRRIADIRSRLDFGTRYVRCLYRF